MLYLVAKPGFVSKDFKPKQKREYIQSGSGVNPLFYAPNCKWTRQQFTKE